MMANSFADAMAAVEEQYKKIQEKVARAAERSQRKAEDIDILAATKTVSAQMISYAVGLGIKYIGENKVQELLEKYDVLKELPCDRQFIGRLQTNKVKYLVDKVSCIQSVDSLRLAQEISRQCLKTASQMNVLVEVNIGGEERKGGVKPEALLEFIDEIRTLPGISIKGLMTVPPACEKESDLFRYFSAMRQYYVDIQAKRMDNVSMECLSMGMSADFPTAIECGATMIRIGSILFGKRDYTRQEVRPV